MENEEIQESDLQKEPQKEPYADETDSSDRLFESLELFLKRLRANERSNKIFRRIFIALVSVCIFLFLFVFFIYLIPLLQEIPSAGAAPVTNLTEIKNDQGYKKQTAQLSRDVQRLSKKYSSYTSGQTYLVINTTDNLFFLYRNKKLIRKGSCSTGSYKMLKTEAGKSWIFKTPKGRFLIQGKTTHPYWKRPDWSFVEEGLPIPAEEDPSRYEYGVLGDYAMSLGDGYLIHGTIYTRFLGLPVTHGCVRLNDTDLEAVFNSMSIGSKVYIF